MEGHFVSSALTSALCVHFSVRIENMAAIPLQKNLDRSWQHFWENAVSAVMYSLVMAHERRFLQVHSRSGRPIRYVIAGPPTRSIHLGLED